MKPRLEPTLAALVEGQNCQACDDGPGGPVPCVVRGSHVEHRNAGGYVFTVKERVSRRLVFRPTTDQTWQCVAPWEVALTALMIEGSAGEHFRVLVRTGILEARAVISSARPWFLEDAIVVPPGQAIEVKARSTHVRFAGAQSVVGWGTSRP